MYKNIKHCYLASKFYHFKTYFYTFLALQIYFSKRSLVWLWYTFRVTGYRFGIRRWEPGYTFQNNSQASLYLADHFFKPGWVFKNENPVHYVFFLVTDTLFFFLRLTPLFNCNLLYSFLFPESSWGDVALTAPPPSLVTLLLHLHPSVQPLSWEHILIQLSALQ